MGRSPEELLRKLRELLGSEYCYFNPPTNLRMSYPCIRVEASSPSATYANNKIYKYMKGYSLTVIDFDPNSKIPDEILETFPYSRFIRSYKADGLNHFVLELYY